MRGDLLVKCSKCTSRSNIVPPVLAMGACCSGCVRCPGIRIWKAMDGVKLSRKQRHISRQVRVLGCVSCVRSIPMRVYRKLDTGRCYGVALHERRRRHDQCCSTLCSMAKAYGQVFRKYHRQTRSRFSAFKLLVPPNWYISIGRHVQQRHMADLTRAAQRSARSSWIL